MSGEFRTNELTAIIGPSGSGKSSLLNVLTGYKTKSVHGSIKLNNVESSQKSIQLYSSYIMQEYKFHKFITVRETLMFTVNCKTTEIERNAKIEKARAALRSS